MSWKPGEYTKDSSSETSPYTHRDEAGYTDPRFYQDGGMPQYVPQQQVIQEEYRGPASLEHYTADAGEVQREAARNGHTGTGLSNSRKEGMAALGGLGAALALIAKFGLAGITALISVAVYASIFGWAFGVGLVALLFVHEMGHAIVMKAKGIPIRGMIFIPMLGAAVMMSRMPHSARDDAEVGIAGPIAGGLGAAVCLLLALANPDHPGVWAALAYFNFLINLLNLVPLYPMDGGRVVRAISRPMWFIGLVVMVAVYAWEFIRGNNSIFLLMIIIISVTQFWMRLRAPRTPETEEYYSVPVGPRTFISLAYFGLAVILALGMSVAHGLIPTFQ